MKHKNLLIIPAILLVAAGCTKEVPEETTAIINETPFQKEGSDYSGRLTLNGYLETENREGVEYANFVFLDTSSDLIYEFAGLSKSNMAIGANKISLGCFEKDKNRIFYQNFADEGNIEGEIKDEDFTLLAQSKLENRVQVRITKPKYTGNQQPASCYSHFRDIDVL